MIQPNVSIISITPVKESNVLKNDNYDAFEVTLCIKNDAEDISSATITTITFNPKMVFTFEREEDECALGGSNLIHSLVDRLRSIAGL